MVLFFPKEIVLLLGITAVFLLVAMEALSYFPSFSVYIHRKRLYYVSLATWLLFLSTIVLRVLNITTW